MKILIPAKLLFYPFWANYVDWSVERNPEEIEREVSAEDFGINNFKTLVEEREVKVGGVENFRKIVGIKKGLLFRSGQLDRVSEDGIATMNELGIRTVVDFRSKEEVSKRRKVNLAEKGFAIHAFPIFNQGEVKRVKVKLLSGQVSPKESEQMMQNVYQYFVEEGGKSLREFFHLLLDEKNYPLLFHCTAGKDRTGFATALLMKMLGFSTEQIYTEYLLSNCFRRQANLILAKKASLFVKKDAFLTLMQARKEFLATAFNLIYEQFGSFENYRTKELGIGDNEIGKLKKILMGSS